MNDLLVIESCIKFAIAQSIPGFIDMNKRVNDKDKESDTKTFLYLLHNFGVVGTICSKRRCFCIFGAAVRGSIFGAADRASQQARILDRNSDTQKQISSFEFQYQQEFWSKQIVSYVFWESNIFLFSLFAMKYWCLVKGITFEGLIEDFLAPAMGFFYSDLRSLKYRKKCNLGLVTLKKSPLCALSELKTFVGLF